MVKKVILFIIILLIPFNIKASTELPVDVLNMSIEEIQEAHSLGLFTYEELVSFYLERIDKYNEQYNCIITINDEAIKQAKELDKEYEKEGLKSKLMGIPIVVKDNIDVYGMPTTAGTFALKDNYPNKNSLVVQNLIDSGAIIIAKSNMSEFAFSANNSKSSYGHTYNAYNVLYSSYGSSGGTAVAVASGLAVAGLGTDTNASIRTPSSANNVVGLRPTFGLVDGTGVIKYDSTRDTVGPITKYVSDNKLILETISGKNINKKENIQNIKIGVLSSWMIEKTNKETTALSSTYKGIVSLMNQALKVFKSNGIEVVEIDDFYDYTYENLVTSSYSAGMTLCYEFNKYIKNTKSKIVSYKDLINKGGYIQYLEEYNINCNTNYFETSLYETNKKNRDKFKKYVDDTMKKYDVDVLIYPTTKNKLLKISETGVVDLKTNSYVIAPTIGYPSINVPLGFDDESLPYGMEILGKTNSENLLYSLALLYEKNTNYYKLPDIAPNLYELPKKIDVLINYYKKNKNEKYKEINRKVKEFFINYNQIDEKESLINKYILEYNELNKEEIKDRKHKKFLIIVFSIVLIILLIMLHSVYKMIKIENKKKFNKKKYFKRIIRKQK